VEVVRGMAWMKFGAEGGFWRLGTGSMSSPECGGVFGSSVGCSSSKNGGQKGRGDSGDRRSLKSVMVERSGGRGPVGATAWRRGRGLAGRGMWRDRGRAPGGAVGGGSARSWQRRASEQRRVVGHARRRATGCGVTDRRDRP
jgi:hypothetical protein